jgi:PPOX class probable F420-dependent enzyme
VLVNLATVQANGQPQVTPVWADFVNGMIRVNTAAGRQKHRNLLQRPQATVLVVDPDDGMRYLEIRGKVVSSTDHDGDEVIDLLAKKNPAETRVTFLIEPTNVVVSG